MKMTITFGMEHGDAFARTVIGKAGLATHYTLGWHPAGYWAVTRLGDSEPLFVVPQAQYATATLLGYLKGEGYKVSLA